MNRPNGVPTFCKQNAQANKGAKRVDGKLTRRRKRKVRGKKRLLFVRWRRKEEGNVEREWKLMRRERNRGVAKKWIGHEFAMC